MGWVTMSERELNRVEVLAQVDDGKLSVEAASGILVLTRRQMFRLLKRYRTDGAASAQGARSGANQQDPCRQARLCAGAGPRELS